MRATVSIVLAGLALAGCDLVGPGDEEVQPLLEVTARSATTLTLRWEAMGTTNTYTADFLTGLSGCGDFPPHNDVLHVTGTTVQLTGLTPSTLYSPVPRGACIISMYFMARSPVRGGSFEVREAAVAGACME